MSIAHPFLAQEPPSVDNFTAPDGDLLGNVSGHGASTPLFRHERHCPSGG